MVDSVLVFPPGFRVLDEDGNPVNNAKIKFRETGGGSGKTVYSDADQTVALGTIVRTRADGFPVVSFGSSTTTLIYADADPYHIEITDADDVAIFPAQDDVLGALDTAGFLASSAVAIRVGSVLAWPTENIPSGFLVANGQAVSRTTYAELFIEYGTRYGVGDGVSTFNVPNYEDYFLRGHSASGTDAGSRTDRGDGTTGATVGTKQDHQIDEHTHANTLTDPGHQHPANTQGGTSGAQFSAFISGTGGGLGGSATTSITINNVATGGNETRPKNITVNWIIVATPAAALATSGLGLNQTWIGARHMTARASSGAGSATMDSGSNDITVPVFDFDSASQEYVHFEWVPPKRWDRSSVTFIPYWTNAAGLAGQNVVFSLAGVAISNDDAINAAMGTAQTSNDSWIAQGDLHRGPESAAITPGGTPAIGDFIVFELSRVVASDNMTGDARLLGIQLLWNSNATSDD